MAKPLMPKATAAWLVDNTGLTFEQIAAFCDLHILEVQAIADGEGEGKVQGTDPIAMGQLTRDEITRCEKDPKAELSLTRNDAVEALMKKKGPKYTPISRRQAKPDAVAWLLKHHPELSDNQICKLIGTTRNTINSLRSKSHWNSANIKSQNPVHLNLCTDEALNEAIAKALKNAPKAEESEA